MTKLPVLLAIVLTGCRVHRGGTPDALAFGDTVDDAGHYAIPVGPAFGGDLQGGDAPVCWLTADAGEVECGVRIPRPDGGRGIRVYMFAAAEEPVPGHVVLGTNGAHDVTAPGPLGGAASPNPLAARRGGVVVVGDGDVRRPAHVGCAAARHHRPV